MNRIKGSQIQALDEAEVAALFKDDKALLRLREMLGISSATKQVWSGTLDEYSSLQSYDDSTLYIISKDQQ